ncbi:mammalian ependymin-related protein 1-like [Babylonia areolata]|uniref:mammalian ependymin-related protein 1-like n=1 Tax=Babylonia areolata TaxID=304850 RepID=UPI003FD4C588
MLGLMVLAAVLCAGGTLAQVPSPCVTPQQFTGRSTQFDHLDGRINRFYMAYDAVNRRRVLFEEQNVVTPGKQFREYLELAYENVLYEINLTLKTCSKSPLRRPWRPYGIPPNATFENEFYMGGPGEEIYAQEWSDRIPYRKREFWVGTFSLKNCYPIKEVLIPDYETLNTTITTDFFDIVAGIVNPNDFIPPPECMHAKWAPPSKSAPFL